MTKKAILGEIEKPDYFQRFIANISQFYVLNKRKVLTIAAVVILVLMIVVGWFTYKYYYEKKAWEEYAEIEKTAVLQESAVNSDILIKKYRDLSSKFSGSQASKLSDYRLGNLYFKNNDIDSAIKSYEKFIANASDENEFKVLSYSSLAYCYESKKDYQKALKALKQAEKIEAGKYFGTFLYRDMGRLYEKMQNRSEALKFYRKALEQSIDPTVTLFIKRKIATLS